MYEGEQTDTAMNLLWVKGYTKKVLHSFPKQVSIGSKSGFPTLPSDCGTSYPT